MNNLSSYCGLVDAKIRASDKDLPVYPDFLFSFNDFCKTRGFFQNLKTKSSYPKVVIEALCILTSVLKEYPLSI
jgi:hypothetical protein